MDYFLIYKKPKIVKIWMHNTQIPLDLIFINEQNKVILIKKGKPFSKKLFPQLLLLLVFLKFLKDVQKN